MKGITHFSIGVAVAACCPSVVQNVPSGSSGWLLVLGGIFGLLPDTLDFRISRFWARRDIEVIPDPLHVDPALIASAVAEAVRRAWEYGRPVRLKLNTVPTGSYRWRRYTVTFDSGRRRVAVKIGPEVTAGQVPIPGTDPTEPRDAESPLVCPVSIDYEATVKIDIFEGPLLTFHPEGHHRVRMRFIEWHRGWSHSLPVAVGWGIAGGLCLRSVSGGCVIAGAYAAHVITDQLGFMGSSLWFPFSRRRVPGWLRMHSGAAFWNFSFVWFSLCLILGQMAAQAAGSDGSVLVVRWLFYGAILPLFALAGVRRWFKE